MRHLGHSLVIVLVIGCGGRPAATVMGGDVPSGATCSVDVTCSAGGEGSILQPAAIVGAAALSIAAIAYVVHLVRPGVRVTLSAPP